MGVDYSDAIPDVTYGYDGVGNRTTMVDGAGREVRSYDAADRLASVTRGGDAFAYTYDDDGRLVTATAPQGATAYTYDKAARLVATTLPNAIVESRSYDGAGRLAAITATLGATSVASFAYTRDPLGNPTAVVASTGTQSYRYDAAGRLASVCYAASCGAASSDLTTWAYDLVGNRTAETTGAVTTSSTYDDADQLTTTGLGLLTTTAYSYDANGHQTAAGSDTFAYDQAGRMTIASTSNGTVRQAYAYDGDSKRLSTTNTTPLATTQTNASWDVSFGVAEVAVERDGGGTLTRSYSYGLDRTSTTTFGTSAFYLHDGLGSVAKLTSASGASQWTYAYQPFGAIRTRTQNDLLSITEQPMRFTGEQLDATGLYHLRARQYDPATGRFTATDPLAPSITDPYVSAYVYADNRPGVLVDPTGERGMPPGAITGVLSCIFGQGFGGGSCSVRSPPRPAPARPRPGTLIEVGVSLIFDCVASGLCDLPPRTDRCSAPQTPTGGGVSPVDLYATGNASGPKVRPSDLGVDGPEDDVCLESESGLLWGASTFARESDLQTRGRSGCCQQVSVVPPDLAVIPDGADYGGVAPTSHHSIVATRSMPFAQFEALYRGLGWINTGRIR